MTLELVDFVLQSISALTAGVAAVYWYKSANVRVPDFSIIGAFSPQFHQIAPIWKWARDTARLSGNGALFAAISAVAFAASVITSVVAASLHLGG